MARFCGASVLSGVADDGMLAVDGGGTLAVPGALAGCVTVALQPWTVRVAPGGDWTVTGVAPDGDRLRVRLGPLAALVAPDAAASLGIGARASVAVDPADVIVLP